MMINLLLSEKEALVVHMLYSLGSKILAGDDANETAQFAGNVQEFLTAKFSASEKKAIARKISYMAASISRETLKSLDIILYE